MFFFYTRNSKAVKEKDIIRSHKRALKWSLFMFLQPQTVQWCLVGIGGFHRLNSCQLFVVFLYQSHQIPPSACCIMGSLQYYASPKQIITVRAPVFGRHQFFGTSEHYGKVHGSFLSWWMNYNYTACCWFPTSSNILILPSQFWQIRFESRWLHCSKCRILVLLRYFLYFLCTQMFTILHRFLRSNFTLLSWDG